jgi:phage repressor protein C with HTH and peptisase S24 domain
MQSTATAQAFRLMREGAGAIVAAVTVIDGPDVYRNLMRFRPEGLTPNAWAVLAGVSRTVWTDMRKHGNPSRRTLEKLLGAAGSSLAEFEALMVTGEVERGAGRPALGDPRPHWRQAPRPPLPVYAANVAAAGGDDGFDRIGIDRARPVETVERPAALAADHEAFAIDVVSEGMVPRFRPGRQIAVSPRAEARAGDDVLVRLANEENELGGFHLIGELTGHGSETIELRQFNPERSLVLARTDISAVQRILGELL